MMENSTLWWRDGVVYQIYPRSFMDTTGDGIGDIPGIISKLNYIADLGVDAVWLSPIYPSPDADFGYDVADYCAIDPKFGTMEDFEILLTQAHKLGLHIILDLVLNHTSDQHKWFVEARKSKDNPYHNYYIWQDPDTKGKPPNNWGSIFGSSAWQWDDSVQQYYLHLFYKEQPDLNWHNPDTHDALLDVFRFWCDKGVDGFRLDVFNLYYKHPQFLDNPKKIPPAPPFFRLFDQQIHRYDYDQPEMMDVLAEIRKTLDTYPERYAVGETFPESPRSAAKYSQPGFLHAAFNFEFTHCTWMARPFMEAIQRYQDLLINNQWPCYVLGNHDLPRPATRYARKENDERLKVAAAMLLTLRGTPFIYYGDELGQRDIPIRKKKDVLDPIGRTFWPFYKGRDGCRAPMQWNTEVNAGFSKGKPWLPLHHNASFRNVAMQETNPSSLLNFYKKLLRLRKAHPALSRGSFKFLTENSRFILAYQRKGEGETFLILLNFSDYERELKLENFDPILWEVQITTHSMEPLLDFNGIFSLHGNQVVILKKKNQPIP